jgi:uncharacterized protein (DUF1697 family)
VGRPSRYVALLRGINLGSRNRVPMAKLREVCEGIGATNVRTYIASGNVVFDSVLTAASLRKKLEQEIEREFGIKIIVVVVTAAELATAIKKNPFPKSEPGSLHAAFSEDDIAKADIDRLNALDMAPEEVAIVGRTIYMHLPKGFGTGQLPKQVDRVKVKVTIRNWRTVMALNEIVNG